jgi:3-deoxy-manno-octulosonate cytidylyltransferase (CMP-KDO synthetase)
LSDNEIIVVNIQGDEPFIQPQQITALCGLFTAQSAQDNASSTEIATLVRPFRKTDTWEALSNPNTPKVVFSNTDRHAILFSRSVIPYLRGIPQSQWLEKECHYGHIGMYAYRGDILGRIVLFPPSPLEQAESLEQLRWLENGITIRVAVSEQQSIGIDTPEDLQKANRLIIDNK